MKKTALLILLLSPILLFAQSNISTQKVLMVVSSYGKDQGASRPGFEFDEFSQAYLVFKNNGLTIDVASPRGGKVEADKFNLEKTYNKELMNDRQAMDLLENTVATANINAADYDAIYIVGGKGAMFDLPFDPSLQDIILELYKRDDTVISSVCHGPASFVNVKDGDKYIIEGVEITSFCNVEEQLFGKKWVPEFPFALEDKLLSRGAVFSQTDFMLSNVAVSGKFVTGQNPFSTTRSAEAVVTALGKNPVERSLYKDEKAVYLIQDILDGKKDASKAAAELAENSETYQLDLIAVYGYYKIMVAGEDTQQLGKAITLIELSSPYFFNEKLQMALAKAYVKVGEKDKAKEVLNDLISKELLTDQATKMLSGL